VSSITKDKSAQYQYIYFRFPHRIENNLTADLLNQYFRAFMIKLSTIESQLGEFTPEGMVWYDLVVDT